MNPEQQQAFNAFVNRDNICMTGAAGSGKSYTLKKMIEWAKIQNLSIGVTATTGSAALLIGGRTIHSFLGIGLGKKSAEDLAFHIGQKKPQIRKTLQTLDVLVIEEMSMMDADLFDKISEYLGIVRRKPNVPFGGVQLCLLGDFTQLPPTNNGIYCFKANAWKKLEMNIICLKTIERQKNDILFQNILNEVRWGKCSRESYLHLKQLRKTKVEHGIIPTILFPKNIDVDTVNDYKFQALLGKLNSVKTTIYKTQYSNMYAQAWAKSSKVPETLTLCPGAQVVCTWNISQDNGIINGTRGIVKTCYPTKVVISLTNGEDYTIELLTIKDEDDPNVSFTFIPLKLAWALTIHKSQGMTLDAVVIDLGDGIFEYGQAYTALSRVRDMKSVRLLTIKKDSFKTHPDVIQFYEDLIEALPTL